MFNALCTCFLLPALAAAQLRGAHEFSIRAVVNAADYSGGAVTPGEIVIVYATNAGPLDIAPWGLEGNLKRTTLIGDTRVLFDNIAAIIIYSVRGQIGTIVPNEVAGQRATNVVVEYQGKRSPPFTLPVIDRAPALFTLDASGKGQAAMLNDTGCCNSVRNPAVRGMPASLYATGEGRLGPGRIPRNVSVSVGGTPAQILYASNIGSLQVDFRVPANAPVGDAVPVVLTVDNRRSSPNVTMAVRSARQRVLILDNDAIARRRLTGILRAAGYQVSTARANGEDRVQIIEQPDLLIFDLAMPDEEKTETIRTLRQTFPRVRIMATSSLFDSEALKQADILGAQAVLKKPLSTAKVLSSVRKLLERRAAVY